MKCAAAHEGFISLHGEATSLRSNFILRKQYFILPVLPLLWWYTRNKSSPLEVCIIKHFKTKDPCLSGLPGRFRTSLQRIPKDQRPQHCYTTAAAMPLRRFPMAKALIEYSLTLEGTWLDKMRAHANLADLYEKQADYQNALDHYRLALEAVPAEQQDRYSPDSAARMLVCQLHLDEFRYSGELRRLYDEAQKLDEFSRSFLKCRFYLTVARSILAAEDGDTEAARAASEQAAAMLRPGTVGPLTALLKRKGYRESTGATKQARAFLNRSF